VYPDFTNLINGTLPADFKLTNNSVCLIPNYRMIDMTNSEASSGYVDFMASVANYLIKQGKAPFILIHEGAKDMKLGKSISERAMNLPVIFESEPRNIKGIIGKCEFVVGSRFHGLVSALSQGVPALATGWSHKYEMLFSDYDFPEGILSVDDPKKVIFEKLDLLIDFDSREKICLKIKSKSDYLKQLSESMWEEVFSTIDSKVH
jgi:colanic acid/amylovoran biosynthesis protein